MSDSPDINPVERIKKSLDEDESLFVGNLATIDNDVNCLTITETDRIRKKIVEQLRGCKDKFIVMDIFDTAIHVLYKKENLLITTRRLGNSQLYVNETEKSYLVSCFIDFTPPNIRPPKEFSLFKEMGSIMLKVQNFLEIEHLFYEFDRKI